MEGQPSVSVVIPVYNGERYLGETLKSVSAQTRPPDEVLVFDNASTDASVSIACAALGADSVRLSATNQGAVANFNRAARESTGEFVLWLAADDRLTARHIESCVRVLADHPKAPACLPGIRFIDPQGDALRETSYVALASEKPGPRLRAFLRSSRWTELYALYRREALLSSPMALNEYGFDVLFTWWFLLRGALAVIPEPLLEYREFPEKSVAEMAESIDPGAATLHWRKLRLWRRLWAMTRDDGVSVEAGRAGRRELVMCWLDKAWWGHLAEDVMLRQPFLARRATQFVGTLRRARR